MYLFSDYLKDVLVEKAVPDSEIIYTARGDDLDVRFNVDGVPIKVSFYVTPDYSGDEYRTMFVYFTGRDPETNKDTFSSLDIGYTHAKTVVDTITKIFNKVVKKYKNEVGIIEFTAKTPGSVKVFTRFSDIALRNGYVDYGVGSDKHKDFILVRSDLVDDYEDSLG